MKRRLVMPTNEREHNWLEGGETPFGHSKLPCLNADIKYDHGLFFYSHGFRRSAEMLFDAMSQGSYADSQYFALAFLWRQAVELQLKALMEDLDALEDLKRWAGPAREHDPKRHPEFAPPVMGHDLRRLWSEVEPRLREIFPNEPETARVTSVIDQFHAVDPRAEEFRYPARMNDGTNTLGDLPRLVNLAELNATRVGLSNFLWAAS